MAAPASVTAHFSNELCYYKELFSTSCCFKSGPLRFLVVCVPLTSLLPVCTQSHSWLLLYYTVEIYCHPKKTSRKKCSIDLFGSDLWEIMAQVFYILTTTRKKIKELRPFYVVFNHALVMNTIIYFIDKCCNWFFFKEIIIFYIYYHVL